MIVHDASMLRFGAIVVFVLAFYLGTIESVKAVFRRQAQMLQAEREAVSFALDHFDELVDSSNDGYITRKSLLLSKFRTGEHADHVQKLLDKLEVYGRSIGSTGKGWPERAIYGITHDDLLRAKQRLG